MGTVTVPLATGAMSLVTTRAVNRDGGYTGSPAYRSTGFLGWMRSSQRGLNSRAMMPTVTVTPSGMCSLPPAT